MFKSFLFLALLISVASAEITKFSDVVVKDLDGNDVPFTKYAGKCVLVINTGKCYDFKTILVSISFDYVTYICLIQTYHSNMLFQYSLRMWFHQTKHVSIIERIIELIAIGTNRRFFLLGNT